MNKLTRVVSAFFMVLSVLSCATTATIAADSPNILIMGEDADKDTIPRNSRVFKRVLSAISNQLNDEGFDVYDETAITLDNFSQGRTRRTDAELFDIAKSIKHPPIDVVTVFSIYANAKKLSYTTKITSRIEGRLLNIKTGQRLGNFEVISPKNWRAPANCDRECIVEIVGKNAKTLADDLGAVLTIKLKHLLEDGDNSTLTTEKNSNVGLPTAYILRFEGFTPDDIHDIEEYIVVFKGYRKHRPTTSGMRHYEYWYETSSDSAYLNRNLTKMLDHLSVKGRVAFSGKEFTIQKITLRKKKLVNPADFQ